MTVTINGTSGITTPGVNSTASNTLGDAAGDTLNVGNGTIVTDSSGNVGIGTSSPSNKFEVVSTTTLNGIKVSGSVDNVALNLSNSGTSGKTWSIVSANSGSGAGGGSLGFFDGTAYRAIIDSSGNLLVGTTTNLAPTSGFAININSNQTFFDIGHVSGTPDTTAFARFYYNGTRIGQIVQSGTTNVAYNTSSDYRLKENVQPMQNALATVAQLNPVTYTWKSDGSDGQGFIAHELQAVVPDCVTGEKDAVDAEGNPVYQGIDTSFLVATLAKAIQELSAKNDALEARITALEAK